MTPRRTVVRRAPGKLFVAGEYAVVEPGTPAILVAVDREVTVTVSEATGADTVVSTDLGPRTRTPHVSAAIDTVGRLLTEHGLPAPPLHLSISSQLHERGRKFGLGSSGAVTVATISAAAAFSGLALSHDHLFRLALLTTARIDPNGSGGDLAASTWGGWIAYRSPDRAFALDLARRNGVGEALRTEWPGLDVRRLPPPEGLALEVGWTGTPASTTSLVSDLHRRTWRCSAAHREYVTAATDLVGAATAALERGDGPHLLHQIRRARHQLARLDDQVGLGIFTTELTALCDVAESVGSAAKPSGAGGGDCGIALLDAEAPWDARHVRERWAAAGVRPLTIRPATQRIEESSA
ncbi:phosphomevalonate kinase [Streptomyces sp. NPDC020412]|uniref:phosphomevalonate kinase n=1 Tax=Streptomyces sp. NPDC020412 TaxID=3365073 RepID=UPI0037AB0562